MARKSGASRNRASAPPNVVPAVYPGKAADGKGMDEPQWTACRDMLDGVYKAKDGRYVWICCDMEVVEE